jgi:energy-coupling factor transport system substrate-specific component
MPSAKSKLLRRWGLLLALAAGLPAGALWKHSLLNQYWALFATGMVFAALFSLYLRFEQSPVSTREIAVIAVLGMVAAASRVPFAALPNIQPATFMVIVSGFVFGPHAGFMVGSTAAVVSNFFLGQGPWTPWQMLAWGLAGTTAGLIGILHPRIGRAGMISFNLIWGYLFGWLMNLWFWTALIHPLNWNSFLATCAAGFWFDTLHALSNVGFYLVFGPKLIRVLKRFRQKLQYTLV